MTWISVEDMLPELGRIVLTICLNDINEYSHPYTPEEAMRIGFYSSGKWWSEEFPEEVLEDNIIHDVTHWMPLPEPPTDKPKEMTEIGPKDFY